MEYFRIYYNPASLSLFHVVSICTILFLSGSFEPVSGGEKNEGAESATKDVEPTSSSGSTTAVSDADRVLEPLKLAFETKNTKLVELALDCFHVRPPFRSYLYSL